MPQAAAFAAHVCILLLLHTHTHAFSITSIKHSMNTMCVSHTHKRTTGGEDSEENSWYLCHLTRERSVCLTPYLWSACRHSARPTNVTLYQPALPGQPLTVNVGQRWRVRAAAGEMGWFFFLVLEMQLPLICKGMLLFYWVSITRWQSCIINFN